MGREQSHYVPMYYFLQRSHLSVLQHDQLQQRPSSRPGYQVRVTSQNIIGIFTTPSVSRRKTLSSGHFEMKYSNHEVTRISL